MGVRLPALTALGALVVLALPAAAHGHSYVREAQGVLAYLSADATSRNALTVRQVRGELSLRDPRSDGGIDPGRDCDAGDVSDDADALIIEALCPVRGVRTLRLDLGEREDRATVAAAVAVDADAGPGADSVTSGPAADVLAGGTGRDLLAGRGGPDRLIGGTGPDRLDGGDGDDVLDARDGVADAVACGPGTDRADVDQRDEVAADCEQVTRTETPPPPFGDDGSDVIAPRLDVDGARVQRILRSRTLRLSVTSTERGTVAASGGIELADVSLPVDTARQSIDVPGAGAELTVRLTGRAWTLVRRALLRRRPVRARMQVVATDLAGNSRVRRAPAIRLVR